MKKTKLFTLLGLGILGLGALSFGIVKGSAQYSVARAEGEDPIVDPVTDPEPEPQPEPEEEVFECSVIIAESKNGTVTVDKEEGHVGEIVTLNVKHDIFYLIKSVSVNGTDLVEDEEIAGKYTFALVEGENKIEAKFVIDEELLGEMSIIMDQAKNKDWANLFTVENVVRVVSFIMNGGILIAIVRYYVKDKRLENKVENKVGETIQAVLPEETKKIVLEAVKEFVTPIFSEMKLDNEDMRNALTVFSRCLALAQENTPEARIAITQELSSLKLSDQASIQAVKAEIEAFIAKENEKFVSILTKMKNMEDTNKQIIEDASETVEPAEETGADGEGEEAHPYE